MSDEYNPIEWCEWDRERDAPAFIDNHHAAAVVSVGCHGEYHLCAECAALPRFKRLRVRKPLPVILDYSTFSAVTAGLLRRRMEDCLVIHAPLYFP